MPPGSSDRPGGPFGPRAPPGHPTLCPWAPASFPPCAGPPPCVSGGGGGGSGDFISVPRDYHRAWLEPSPVSPSLARGLRRARLSCRALGWGSSVPGRRNYFWPAFPSRFTSARLSRKEGPLLGGLCAAARTGSVSGISLPRRPGTPQQAQGHVCRAWGFHTSGSVVGVCACFSFQAATLAALLGEGQWQVWY